MLHYRKNYRGNRKATKASVELYSTFLYAFDKNTENVPSMVGKDKCISSDSLSAPLNFLSIFDLV